MRIGVHGDYRANTLILARHVGVLLACFTVDYRVLFEPLTEEIVQDGFQYYKTFFNAPLGIKVRTLSYPFSSSLHHNAVGLIEFFLFLFFIRCVRASHNR